MAQKWYQKASVQTAIITGLFVLAATIIGSSFGLFEGACSPDTPKQPSQPVSTQSTTVGDDITATASQGSAAVVVTGEGTAHVSVGISEESYNQLLEKMDAARAELQEQLDQQKRRAAQLVRGVERAHAEALTVSRYTSNPEITRLGDTLRNLLAQFDAKFGSQPLPEVDDLRIRLTRATLANADGHYKKTLTIVTEDDLKAERAATEAQIDREVEANQVRGDAFHGLRQWQSALAHYERILELRPSRWSTCTTAADCLKSLGRLTEALVRYDMLVSHYARLVEEEGKAELANNFATSLTNRGTALNTLGRLDDAIHDFNKAIDIYTRLVEREGRGELADYLAGSLNNRGLALCDQGKLDDAIRDFDKAIDIQTRLVEQEGRAELANDLAGSVNNRGNALCDQGRLDDALRDYDKAVLTHTRLVEQEGRAELANDLAGSLNNRGNALCDQGRLDDAIRDFDKAVDIYTRLVKQEGRAELANDLAGSLYNRGITLAQQDKQAEAIADLKKAIPLATDPRLRKHATQVLRELGDE